MEAKRTFTSVWNALEDTPADAQRMKLKIDSLINIVASLGRKIKISME